MFTVALKDGKSYEDGTGSGVIAPWMRPPEDMEHSGNSIHNARISRNLNAVSTGEGFLNFRQNGDPFSALQAQGQGQQQQIQASNGKHLYSQSPNIPNSTNGQGVTAGSGNFDAKVKKNYLNISRSLI